MVAVTDGAKVVVKTEVLVAAAVFKELYLRLVKGGALAVAKASGFVLGHASKV